MSFYDITSNSPGSLLTKLSIDTMQLNNLVLSILGSTIQCGFCFILGLIFGCYYEYRLTLINFCFMPFIVAAIIIRRGLNENSGKKGLKTNIEAGGILSECVTNTKTIYSFNFQESAIEMYMDVLEYNRSQFVKDSVLAGLFVGIGQFCVIAGNTAVIAAAKHYIINNKIETDGMIMAINIVSTTSAGIGNGLGQLGDTKKVSSAFKSIYSTLDTNSLIKPFKCDNENKINAENIKGKIEFKNVYFAYPTRPEQVILKNVSFIIYPGQQVAFVGYSGSGKSTIIQLLERFYDIEEGKGEILIDDINIKDYNLYELRKKIGLISQEPMLFKRGLYENILYGNLEASRNDVFNVANKAALREFLNEKEFNLNEKSSSQGEKQRISIARTFLKNPAILLLDDATSSLDHDSEKEIRKKIIQFQKGRTSVYVTHRLSNIINYDIIFFMDKGTLVEQGNHNELIEKRGNYYNLYIISEK